MISRESSRFRATVETLGIFVILAMLSVPSIPSNVMAQAPPGSRAAALSNGVPLSGTASMIDYTFATAGNYYNVFAVKPGASSDFDMRLYSDSTYLTQTAFSNAGGSAIDLVVLNRNGDYGTTTYYPRVPQFTGNSYYIEAQYNTTALAINTTANDAFTANEIFDSWDCYLTSGKTYEIILTSTPSGALFNITVFGDTSYMTHYPSTYGYLATGNQVNSIKFTPPATKYYCIVVLNENGVSGAYSLFVKQVPPASPDTPTPGTLSTVNKWDFWQTTATANKYAAYAVRPPSGNDFDIEVYDSFSRSNLVASSSYSGDKPDLVVLDRVSSGTAQDYYVKIKQYSSYYGTYGFEYQMAGSATAGVQVTGTMGAGEVLDDWQISLSTGILYDLTFTTMPAGAQYDAYLFSSTGGASVYSYVASGDEATPLSYQPTVTDTYCIVLVDANAWTGSYAFTMAQNQATLIYPLTLDTPRAQDTITAGVPAFKYSYTATKGLYSAIATMPPGSMDFDLRLYSDSAYSSYLGGSFYGAGLEDIYVYDGTDLTADSIRYPKVSQATSGDTGLVTIEADAQGLLTVNTQKQRTIGAANLVDVFTVSLTSGKEYVIEFPTVPAGTSLSFYLLKGSGTTANALASGTSSSAVTYTPAATDEYALLVVTNGASGTYKIVAREIPRLVEGATVLSTLASSRPFDEYRFKAIAGRYSAVAVKPLTVDFNSNLRVYSDIWMTNEVSYSTVAGSGIDAVIIDGTGLGADTDYFAKVYISSGSGDYRITYTSKFPQTVGSTITRTMDASEVAELGNVNLTATKNYSVIVASAPAGALYNIYVYDTTAKLIASIATGSQSSPASFTASSTSMYSFLVTNENAIGGSYNVRVVEAAVPEFTMAVTPASASFQAGSGASFSVQLTARNGFASAVTLTVLSSLPAGMTAVFSPVSPTPTATSTLYVNTTTSTPVGTYQIQFQAQGGGITIASSINVTVTTPPVGRDLVVYSVDFSPYYLVESVAANYTAVVKNTGDTDVTTAFSVNVYFDSSGTPAKTFSVSFLAASQTTTLSWTTMSISTPGKHTVRTVADATSAVSEVNEANNEQVSPAYVARRVTAGSTFTNTIDTQSDSYFYAFVTASGAAHWYNMTGPAGTDFDLYLRSSSGSILASNTSYSYPEVKSYSAGFSGFIWIEIRAYTGTGTFTFGIDIVYTVPDFSMSSTVSMRSIEAGNSTSYPIRLTSIDGFATAVSLTIDGATLPASVTYAFSPNPATPTADVTLTLNTLTSTSPGTYQLRVVGTGGTLTRNLLVNLTVNSAFADFTISCASPTQSIPAGNTAQYDCEVQSLGAFSGSISFSLQNLPSGVTSTLSSSSLSFTPGQSRSLAVRLIAAQSAPLGTFSGVIVRATGPDATRSISLNLTITAPPVSDFALSVEADSVSGVKGDALTLSATVMPVGVFSGTVAFSSTISGGGSPKPSVTFSPTTIAGGDGTTTITVTIPGTCPEGQYNVVITASSGSKSHQASLKVQVLSSPDFAIVMTPADQTVQGGSEAYYEVSITSRNEFDGIVDLVYQVTSGTALDGYFDVESISPSEVATLTVSAASAPVGTYSLKVTGTSGTLTHSVTVKLRITPAPSVSITASPKTQVVTLGDGIADAVTFTIALSLSNAAGAAVTLDLNGLPPAPAVVTSFSQNPPYAASTTFVMGVSVASNAETGTYNFTVTAFDDSLAISDMVDLTLVIESLNARPYFASFTPANTSLIVTEGQNVSFSVDPRDSDGTVEAVSFSLDGRTVSSTSAYTFATNHSTVFSGAKKFTVVCQITDDDAVTSFMSWNVTVLNSNMVPDVVLSYEPMTDITSTTEVTFDASLSHDPDGDPLAYVWYDNGVIVATSSELVRTFSGGVHNVSVQASDLKGGFDTQTISIRVLSPSLFVRNITFSKEPSEIKDGDTVRVTGIVENHGDGASAATSVELLIDFQVKNTATLPSVGAHLARSIELEFLASAGQHVLEVNLEDASTANDYETAINIQGAGSTSGSPAPFALLAMAAVAIACVIAVARKRSAI